MLTDIQIAQQNELAPISEIAEKIGFNVDDIDLYGKYKAKVPAKTLGKIESNENGKLILVTAINPTPAGEGKSTITVGLGDALSQRGKSTMIALREPSLGPTMGVKGGAAGGGYAQIQHMEDIKLNFIGDIHVINYVNNILYAFLDN